MAIGRSTESIERCPAVTSCCSFSMSFLRLLLLTCLVAVAVFTSLTHPLLGAQQVHVVLPDKSAVDWHKDVIVQDYHVRDSEAKFADLNETFLSFAMRDPNEEQERRKIKMLMDSNELEFRNSHMGRSSYQRRMDHYMDLDRPRVKVRPRYESWLLQLQSPKFRASWPRFRHLLQVWFRNKRHDPRVMGELWETVKKPIDKFYSEERKQPLDEGMRYRTCAVVGNSGILLNRSFGSFIDSHDMVIRLNNAKVAGFTESVGSKTTLSFVNSNIYHSCSRRLRCFCHPYGNVPIVMYLCQVQHLMDVAFCETNHRAPVLVTDARFDNLCARIVKWYSVKHYVAITGNSIRQWGKDHNARDFHYSSGLQAIVLALGLCEHVDILGFGKSSAAKHHYHTNQKGELDLHDYEAEYLFYDDLVGNRTSTIPFLSEAGIHIPPVRIYR